MDIVHDRVGDDPDSDMSSTAPPPSSLSILKPRPWASRKSAWESETARYLAHISGKVVDAASARDWQNPMIVEHVHPDYHAEFDHAAGVPLLNWADYVAHHERLATANPDYRFDVLDSVADVYEKTGTAQCFLLLRVTGHPINVVRESVIIIYWRRQDQGWQCTGQRVVRGMFWNA